jgi:hypothetical protein
MAVIASEFHPASTDRRGRKPGLLADFRAFCLQFFARAFDPYRPELHYMRGPGPAWRAKQMASSHLHST